jgi:hypothetical protein
MPAALTDVLPLVPWRLDLLHALDLPVRQIPLDELSWQFALPLWQLDGVRFQITPYDVAADPARYSAHYERVMDSDLDYPIDLVEYRGRLVVLDGNHRLLKASFLRRSWIAAHVLSAEDLESIRRR